MTMTKETRTIGEIGVDAGLCWIGDPCYCVTPDADEHPAETWSEFCGLLGNEHPTIQQFNYKLGHPGLGICVSTGFGDGVYPVTAEIIDGRVASVTVTFIEDKPLDED